MKTARPSRSLYWILLLSCWLIPNSGYSQTPAEEKLGAWYMYFGINRIAERLSIHSELQVRTFQPLSNFNQFLPQIGLNWHFKHNAILTAGYGFMPGSTFDAGSGTLSSREHRIWQQFILLNKIGRLKFEHRYRFEERWLRNDFGTQYLNRARYRLLMLLPLNHPEMEANTFFLALFDEILLNLQAFPFDQNRLYGALGYKLNKTFSFQAGYMYHRVGLLNLNRLMFAVFINPNFRKQ